MLREMRDWLEELACRAGLDGLPGPRGVLTVAAVVLALGVGAWLLLGSSPMSAPDTPASAGAPMGPGSVATSSLPAQAPTVTVHVVGEVRRAGVYELAGGSRVRDAVDAAGGLLGDAAEAALNLARVLVDGEQIVVPREGQAGAAAPAGGGPTTPGGKVGLNTATAEQLDALPGIGPATAAKIVADRTANGPFRSVDDLMRVPGIGPAKFEALRDLVSAQ